MSRRRWRALLAASLLWLPAACAGGPAEPPAGARTHAPEALAALPSPGARYLAQGVASWYGGRFHGRRTASGERFDQNGHTAAHPSLPFGTRVRVTNLENGRSVILVINDRGPFKKGRIIDVSRRAAADLGFQRQGLARVRVEALAPDQG